eukprot:XP_008182522.1 PREDICTED: KRAB-A domain-containing protein 2-like [Acyrthosiphon pisum]
MRYMIRIMYQDHHGGILSILLTFGAPKILQSDNGREFVNSVINELKDLWPECVIVHGRPRHPQSQGSIERSNQDVEHMLRAWMADNKSKKWSVGLNFVQFQKNSSFHRTIGRSPYIRLCLEMTQKLDSVHQICHLIY